jgi:lambda family phage portal protein
MMTANGHRVGINGEHVPRGTLFDSSGNLIGKSTLDPQAMLFPIGGGTGYGNYGANTTKNALLGWLWRGGDADTDIGLNVQVLRERSRDAFMGVPLAAGAIETYDVNVIGEGLYPAPNVDGAALGMSADAVAKLNQELAEKFEWWATNPRECDFESRDTFYLKQSVILQSLLLSGDVPVLFPLKPRPKTTFEFRLRVLEADRIMNPNMGVGLDPLKNIFSGVELTDEGELLAYHIAERHPLATNYRLFRPPFTKTFRVEPFGVASGRRNMVLVMRPERPEQRRGVPILSVCLELIKQMGRFTDSTVIAAVIQSYFTAFITQEFPDPNIFDSLLTDQQKQQILNFNPYNVQLGPGVVNFMRPGHSVNFATPTQPMASFDNFTMAVAKFVGAAAGIPYEVLLKQYNASYSASRAALLDFWKRVRKYRALMIDQFCQPSYEEWVADAVSLNVLDGFKGNIDDLDVFRALARCNWSGASAGSLDPQKEVGAAEAKVNAGFSTIERETMELNGSNYRDNIRQQSTEKKEFTDADLTFPPERAAAQIGEGTIKEPTPPPPPSPPTKAFYQNNEIYDPTPVRAEARARRSNKAVELASGLSGAFVR